MAAAWEDDFGQFAGVPRMLALSDRPCNPESEPTSLLNLFLRDLDDRKGKLSHYQEVCRIQRAVRKVINTLLLEVRREKPFLVTTLVNSGSFYEGTKIAKPDEFDFFVQLDSFSGPEDIEVEELPCSTVAVIPTESALKNWRLCFNYKHDYEWKRSIKGAFFDLFNSKAKDFKRYGMSVELPVSGKPLKKCGPAYTLFLRWTGGDFYKGLLITVDLTLAVRINSRSSKLNLEFSSPAGQVLKSLLDSVPRYFAIGSYRNVLTENQPNFFEENANVLDRKCKNLCLRCSQSCLEQAIFCYFGLDGGQAKCLRLLKLLRELLFEPGEHATEPEDRSQNNNGLHPIRKLGLMAEGFTKVVSSFVLKTLVLYEWKENPEDNSWSENNLSERLLSILRKLLVCLEEKKLFSFFYKDYNIFTARTVDSVLTTVRRIVTYLINQLESIDKMKSYNFKKCFQNVFGNSYITKEYTDDEVRLFHLIMYCLTRTHTWSSE